MYITIVNKCSILYSLYIIKRKSENIRGRNKRDVRTE